MQTQYEIAIIGSGNAAEGIVHGILRRSILLDDRIIATDPNEARRELFTRRFGIAVTDDNRRAVENSYIVLLAVKPQQFKPVVEAFADLIRPDHVIISIMAGVSTATLEAQFPQVQARVIRVMPNLAMHVGAGMAGLFRGRHAQEVDLLRAQRIFDAAGKTLILPDEALMDAVTAVSGTGPAYFYYFTETIVAAGEAAGLSHQEAMLLATQACYGAACMMMETKEPPSVLRQKVTSAGGTTQAAMDCMRNHDVFEHIKEAVVAACNRSRELGR
ncbi:MAG: pyrroline-5-carboxylate reductase [Phycisphaerae bacterium]|nr:pyrroline-5-carboxylate reductase [Phycisphaerae bacterium]